MSMEAERAIIGGILWSGCQVPDLSPSDFHYFPQVWAGLCQMRDLGVPLSLNNLATHCKDHRLGEYTEVLAAGDADGAAVSQTDLDYQVTALRAAVARRQGLAAVESFRAAFEQAVTPAEVERVWSEWRRRPDDVRLRQDRGLLHAKTHAQQWLAAWERRRAGLEKPGIPTGFKNLDYMIGGLEGGRMIVIAARPGKGKTTIALNIIRHVALTDKHPVHFFSLEMTGPQVINRLVIEAGNLSGEKLRAGTPLTLAEEQGRARAVEALATSQLFIDDSSHHTAQSIAETVGKAAVKPALVVVDYLQIVKCSGKEKRQEQITEISQQLKALSKDHNIPVLVLAQLNRESESRKDGTPRISDLRESGAIEQDADIVGLLHWTSDDKGAPVADVKLMVEKNRDGTTGDVDMEFDRTRVRFRESGNYSPVM